MQDPPPVSDLPKPHADDRRTHKQPNVTDTSKTSFAKHFHYVFGSQMIVLITGFIKALVIPVVLGISDYGYWQIYVFYTIYIGAFTFGYIDGIYLKYGGYRLQDLPLEKLRAANWLYIALLAIGTAALATFAASNAEPQRQFIFYAIAANVAVLGITANISLTLQASNLLKGYAFLNSADKIFFALALLALVGDEFRTFSYLIAMDLLSKVVVMAVLVHRYRQLFIGRLEKVSEGIKEFLSSVASGIQLLLANLSGMLVLGIGRIIIEYFDALESYAYYAFAISLANVVLISVSALSIVIYPTLKRQPQENYLGYFNKTNRAFLAFSFLMLTGYFPALAFIDFLATSYQPVIEFLNAMFVITVLQGKMQLVNNTYYKALRLENRMLIANLSSMVIVAVLAAAGYMWTHSVLAIAYATLVTMVFRVYASELFLRHHMGETFSFRPLSEGLVLAFFLVVTSTLSPMIAFSGWLLFVALVALGKRDQLAAYAAQIWDRTR